MDIPELRLISHKLCPYVQRARIVLEEKSVPHDIEFIDLGNKPRWFTDLSPLGKVPLLLADEEVIFESAVIAEYLDEITEGSLHPVDALQRAKNRAWIEFASRVLESIAAFYSAPTIAEFRSSVDSLRTRFQRLEDVVGDGPWFNGSRFSLVDAAFGPVFRYFDVFDEYTDLDLFANTPGLRTWREALRERPSVRKAAVEDYPSRLLRFISARRSVLAEIIRSPQVA